jgi:hypothetical protein
VDELKEELAKQTDEYPKPSKIKRKRTKTARNDILDQEREKATASTATADQGLSMEERIAKLPPEAQLLVRENMARAKAAERDNKMHGEEGDREYQRLLKKEQQEKGEIPATGDCPHCGEKLEAPIIRGHHDICWEAKEKRGNQV